MERRRLGRTGLEVSDLSLGTMMFGPWGNDDDAECEAMVHRALDAGVNLVDTADMYSDGRSEQIVGAALRGRRDDVVLATKFWAPMGEAPNRGGASRRWIMAAVEDSLRRLGTDWIDLYQLHRPDPHTDLDETMGALSDLVHQGKVRYAGTSCFPAERLVRAAWRADVRGHEPFVCEQPPYSLFVRDAEAAVLPTCAELGMGVIVWGPLNAGWLTGKYRRGEAPPEGTRAAKGNPFVDAGDERKLDLVEALAALAGDAGLTLTQLALAWVREHPAVTSAIVGPRTPEQLDGLLAAADVRLEPALLDAIDELIPPGTTVDPTNRGMAPWGLAAEQRRRPRP